MKIEKPTGSRRANMARCRPCRRLFFYLYPSNGKPTPTPEGEWMRRVILFCLIGHIVFFIVSLCLIGFIPMMNEVMFICWSYAVYLCLREWEILLYMFALVMSIIYGVYNMVGLTSLSLLFYIINEIFFVFALYYTFRAYREFRYSGGIKGYQGKKT